jgi:hypothetical protein
MFGEAIAVYCQNHTEHINTLCGQNAVYINSVRTSQETHYISATKPNRLMLFREIIAVYRENYTEHIHCVGRLQSAEFHYVKADCTNSYHCPGKGTDIREDYDRLL